MTEHDHNTDELNDDEGLPIITFENEDGETIEFVQLIAFEYEDSEYAALTPAAGLGTEDVELFVFNTGVYEDERFYTPVEDDELAQRVFDIAVQLLGGTDAEV